MAGPASAATAVAGRAEPSDVHIAVVGHAASGRSGANGQILRTRIVIDELRHRLGANRIHVVDTGAGTRGAVRMLRDLLQVRRLCSDLVFMPGSRGLRTLLPLYVRWKRRRGLRLHYLVVGGWLPAYLRARPQALPDLRACTGVHVQTRRMVTSLQEAGLNNVRLLPNFRRFPLDRPRSGACSQPLRTVFMSRVIPEKGVELALRAVEHVNAERGGTVATLDLWGPVEARARDWFSALMTSAGPAATYRGALSPDAVHARLVEYDVMLFPTFYAGEGFPGVILDAMIAGIPVIASDWQDNAEFVEDGRNGLLFPAHEVDALTDRVRWAIDHPDEVMRMKHEAASRAGAFHVDAIFPGLLEDLGLAQYDRAAVLKEERQRT